ncbi:DNA polymerase subunit Cdc27 [Fomes fomentarius]|nr:DNA polymerase subunit Cdc27 [Fomes fomentarius]
MANYDDYLTKQLYIEKNVVTYRSLSRQFGIHVNEAKNELARFFANSANSETRSFATYLVSGELFPTSRVKSSSATQTDDGMDVDSEPSGADMIEEGEEVPTMTMTLVGENDLEHTKSKYARIFSTHVYCLSPSPLSDADHICGPSNIVYNADAKDAPTSSIALGRVVGPDVYVGKVSKAPVASTSKAPEPVSRKPTLKAKVEDSPPRKSAEKTKEAEKPATVRPKASGKLDWSKAKKPSDSDKNKVKVKKEESESPLTKVKAEKIPPKTAQDASPQDDSKRGTKRKAAPPPVSDAEEQLKEEKRAPTPTKKEKGEIKLRKNRVVSDDEDEGTSRAAAIQSVLESQQEASLRAMMDMDDSQVENASASRPPPRAEVLVPEDEDVVMASEPEEPPKSEPEEEEDEIEIEIEDTPKPKPRKKKEKKVVPVGRNGLKKRRVMKTRMFTDAKGFMVSEDYSEYESVDEEAPEEETQKKTKGKKAAPAKPKKGGGDDVVPAKSKPPVRTNSIKAKGSGAKASSQGNLRDFFGKPKK